MAKISSYTTASAPSLSDMLIGTDVANNNETKNFTLSEVLDLFQQSAVKSYGSYYDVTDQVASSVNSATAMKFGITEYAYDIPINSGTQITFTNGGVYNIQFSAQFHDTGGGSGTVDIWLAKNGVTVGNTNTKMVLSSNSYHVAAWNFFVNADAGDYYEIMWATSDLDVIIQYDPFTGPAPATPSVILTVNKID